jgi:hypothetical protein
MKYTIDLVTGDGIARNITRPTAARALAVRDGGRVLITFTDTDGDEHDLVEVYARDRRYGTEQPAHVSWASTSAVFGSEDARAFAQAVTIAAEIAALADEIAAEKN